MSFIKHSSWLLFFICSYCLTPAQASNLQNTSPAATKRSASTDLYNAKLLFEQGDLNAALEALERGLRLAPNNVDGLNLLGLIYHQQHRYPESVKTFQKALQINPRSVETLNNLANSYATQEKFGLAEQTFRETLRLEPRNRAANYNLGLLLLASHRPRQAIAALQRVQPQDLSTRLNLAQAYLNAGLTSEGLHIAQGLSAHDPKDVKLHFSLGVVLAASQKYGPAIHEFEIANALSPRTFEILHDLGQAHLRNGESAQAELLLEQALQLQPDSVNTLYLLAQAKTDQHQDVEALEFLGRARKLAPQNTDILLLLARLSMKQSFYEDAIPLLLEAIKIDSRRADLRAALGESYFTIGKVNEAIEVFKYLLHLDPSAQSYAFMGLCYRHLGRFDEAKRYLKEGLKTNPRSLPILFSLGFIAKKQGQQAQAEQYMNRALQIDPSYAEALFEMGNLKMEQRKYAEAIALFRRCAEVSPRSAQAYYKLATAERNLHRWEAAQRDMKVFVTLSKNPQPGPYPLQNFFDYLERRQGLSIEKKTEVDLHDLETEVRQHPDRPRSLYLLAEAYLKANRVDEAMQIIKRLDTLSEKDFRTLSAEGVLLARFRFYPAAIRHFQEAIAADPDSDEMRYNLANAQFLNHEDAAALQSLQQMSPAAQKDDAYLGLLGDIYSHSVS